MRNLVAAGFERYRKNKLFWFVGIGAFILGLLEGLFNFKSEDWVLVAGYPLFFGIVILVSAHIGQEYSAGTIRNKLIMGYRKEQLLFSDMILQSCVILGIMTLYWIPYFCFFYPVLFNMPLLLGTLFLCSVILLCIATAVQLVTFSYLIPSKTGGIIANIFQIFVLPILLMQLDVDWFMAIEEFDVLYMGDPLSQFDTFSLYFVCKYWWGKEEWQYLDASFLSVRYPLISVIRCVVVGMIGWIFIRRKNIK